MRIAYTHINNVSHNILFFTMAYLLIFVTYIYSSDRLVQSYIYHMTNWINSKIFQYV